MNPCSPRASKWAFSLKGALLLVALPPLPLFSAEPLPYKDAGPAAPAASPRDTASTPKMGVTPATAQAMRDVLDRYARLLLQEPIAPEEQLRHWIATQAPDGSWPDIDYTDRDGVVWRVLEHINRMGQIARAWAKEGHALHGNAEALSAVARGIDCWGERRPRNPNWFYNRIGLPIRLIEPLVLVNDALEESRRQTALSLMDQATEDPSAHAHYTRETGSNLVEELWPAILLECIRQRPDKIADYADRLWADLRIGGNFRPDGSYLYHGNRLFNWAYGDAHFRKLIRLAYLVNRSPWQAPPDARAFLSHYLLDGNQWMARQGFLSPAAIDRAIWKKDALLVADTFAPAMELWAEVDTERAAELKAFARSLRGEGDPLVGFRFFPFGDFAGFHRPGFACLLKTITQRSWGVEENAGFAPMSLNWVNTGECFLLRDGREYNNLQPVWDWSRLPGLTIDGTQKMPTLPALGGGVGDGISGLVAVDVERVHGDWKDLGGRRDKPGVRESAETEGRKVGTFTLRKLFAMHGDTVVCLLGGWQRTGQTGEFSTSLDQCRWRGPVLAADADQPARPLPEGRHTLAATRWVLHQKFGYMPLLPAPFDVSLRKVSGRWSNVSTSHRASDPGDNVDEELLTIVFPHGAEPSPTGYVVVGDASPEKMEALRRRPTWTVLANTRDLQAVRFAGGPLMAAFYAPGQLTAEGLSLSADRPCLIMVGTEGAIRVADPLFKGGPVSLVLNSRTVNLALPVNGATVEASAPKPNSPQ